MLMKQLRLHINHHYKAILIFWIIALVVKGTTSLKDLEGIQAVFLRDMFDNTSIAITIFIVISTFFMQLDVFRIAISFGTTRLQFFIGTVCYIILQSAFFALLQILFLQDVFYVMKNNGLFPSMIEQFCVQFLLYVMISSLFQVIIILQQRFSWIGLGIGATLFLNLISGFYGRGIKELIFTKSGVLMNISSFITISIGLTVFYFIVSGIFIRKISLEQTV